MSPSLFCRRIVAMRKQRKLTQTELETFAGLPEGSVSQYETGRREPGLYNLYLLCSGLRVSADYLIGRSTVP